MTGRERIRNTIERKETDRMPIDLGMHFSTGISVFAYYNLRKYLGLKVDNIEMIDTVQMLARVDDDVLARFQVDTVLLNPHWKKIKRWNIRGEYDFIIPEEMNPIKDSAGDYHIVKGTEKMRLPAGGYFFDGNWLQFKNCYGDEYFKMMAKESERVYKESDKFTCMMGFRGCFDGIDHACEMLTDEENAFNISQKSFDDNMREFSLFVKSGGENVDSIEINSDLGMQIAPMVSPTAYEKFIFPFLKKFVDYVHNNSNAKVFLHSCGSIMPLIPYFIEAGVDVLNPVQISASGMEPQTLKDKFGDKITFWGGGANTQAILPFKTAKEVSADTERLIKILDKNGGYVFNQVHNIMGNIPPENIVAMFDTAIKCGAKK